MFCHSYYSILWFFYACLLCYPSSKLVQATAPAGTCYYQNQRWFSITTICTNTCMPIDPSHKSHNAPVLYPTIYHFVTEMCTCVHISVTKWCIVGYLFDTMWDLWDHHTCLAVPGFTTCICGKSYLPNMQSAYWIHVALSKKNNMPMPFIKLKTIEIMRKLKKIIICSSSKLKLKI